MRKENNSIRELKFGHLREAREGVEIISPFRAAWEKQGRRLKHLLSCCLLTHKSFIMMCLGPC